MLEAAGRQGGTGLVKTRYQLRKMVGDLDAEAMLTGVAADDELASLGLITGLTRLARGEITRDDFARTYGHRGPHEFELSAPRPGEDPGWSVPDDRQNTGAPLHAQTRPAVTPQSPAQADRAGVP